MQAAAAGCWDVELLNAAPPCLGWNCTGAIVQVRQNSSGSGGNSGAAGPMVVVSAVIPTRDARKVPVVALAIKGLRLRGGACTPAADGSGTVVEVRMDPAAPKGATASAACQPAVR